jgi:hypothetical protein
MLLFNRQQMKKSVKIPFDFVIEKLDTLDPVIKPMFGCHAIYVRNKIVVILRRKSATDPDNGVWIATLPEHHATLKKDFPSMRSIEVFGGGTTGWQNLPEDADDFEENVFKVCDLILKGDVRIGKIPKKKKAKS